MSLQDSQPQAAAEPAPAATTEAAPAAPAEEKKDVSTTDASKDVEMKPAEPTAEASKDVEMKDAGAAGGDAVGGVDTKWFQDPSFVTELLGTLPGVDINDPRIQEALKSVGAGEEEKDKKDGGSGSGGDGGSGSGGK